MDFVGWKKSHCKRLHTHFISFGWIAKNGFVGSCDVCLFNLTRVCQTVFYSDSIISHSYQQWMKVPVAPHQHLMLKVKRIFYVSILIHAKWYLTAALICIFLITNNIKHILMCLFASCTYSLIKCLFKYFPHVFLHCLFSYYCVWRVLYIYSGSKSSLRDMTCKCFHPVCDCLFFVFIFFVLLIYFFFFSFFKQCLEEQKYLSSSMILFNIACSVRTLQ